MENESKRVAKRSTDRGTDVNVENPDAVNSVKNDGAEEQQKEEAPEYGSEQVEEEEKSQLQQQQPLSTRTFTDLSQVDADAALGRTLPEEALMMNTEGSDYGSWEDGRHFHEEEDDFTDSNDDRGVDAETGEEYDENAFDVHAHSDNDDTSGFEYYLEVFSSDEVICAIALQDTEERELAYRMVALAGINEEVEEIEEHLVDLQLQDRWEEVDPDELSYEELLALGEVIGSESRGLSTDTIASLPSVQHNTGSSQHGRSDSCVICRLDYEEEETLTVLSCKHSYHTECISRWLQINKVCPICNTEVVPAGKKISKC